MAGKPTPKAATPARSRVTRAKPSVEGRDPGPVGSKADVNEHTTAKPGQQATGKTVVGSNTPVPPRGPAASSVPSLAGRGVRDRSSAATGTSIFDKADARNRQLGRRNRTS